MIDDVNKYEIIEKYILGQLKGELLLEFEKKLSIDEQFKKEVDLEKAIYKNLRTIGRNEYRLKLNYLHQKINEHPSFESEERKLVQIKVNRIRNYWVIAASVALMIACSITIYFLIKNTPDPDSLFSAHFQPYPGTQLVRGAPEVTESKTAAFVAYNQGNYQESINLFEKILAEERDEEVLFYLGNAYLSANMPQEAEKVFKQYLNQYKEFEVEAKWYLSLSYLKQSKIKEAKTIFEDLSNNNNFYSARSIKILNDLE